MSKKIEVTIKKVTSDEPNVSKRNVSYDVYHNGNYHKTFNDINDALDHKEKMLKEAALFEEKCRRAAYATARKLVKQQIQEKYELNEEEADSLVDSKVSLIKKYANRLLPKIKQTQINRHRTFHTGSEIENLGQPERREINEHIDTLFTERFAPTTGMSAGEEQKATHLRGTTEPVSTTDKKVVTLQPPQTNKQPQVVFNPPDRRMDNPKVQQAIGRKAAQSNTPDVVLREVFARGLNAWTEETGVSPEQYGFARVNSFIRGGKSYKELDADLVGLDESILGGLAAMGGIALGAGAVGAAGAIGKAALEAGTNRLAQGKAGGTFKQHFIKAAGMKPNATPAPAAAPAAPTPAPAQGGTTPTALHGTNVANAPGLPTEDKPTATVHQALRSLAIRGAAKTISNLGNYKVGAVVSSPGAENAGMMPSSGLQR